MAANSDSWIAETVGDFIHSHIWGAPINTFIEANCAAFDYDDDDSEEDDTKTSSTEEQMNIHRNYQRLTDALIESLGKDLDLDQKELKQVCQLPANSGESVIIDEPFEQLYAARDFQLFQEMMRRKNLILQLQALVTLQLQWGLLKQSETGEDLVLSLLLQATTSSSHHGSGSLPVETAIESRQVSKKEEREKKDDENEDDDDVVIVEQKMPPPSHKKKEPKEPKKAPKPEYRLPDVRRKGGSEVDTQWHRDLQKKNQTVCFRNFVVESFEI